MNKFLLLAIIFFSGVILTIPISAADTGTIAATVTPKLISVAVSPNTIIYGTVALGQNDVAPPSDTEIGVNNNGTVSEKLSIKGDDASAIVGVITYYWTLSESSTGTNQFMHKVRYGSGYSTIINLSTNYVQLVASEAANFGESLKFRISMPTGISGPFTQYNTTVTILAQEAS